METLSARYDSDPKHVVLTTVEFDRLCEVSRIPEKENFFFLVGLFVPCAIAVYSNWPTTGSIITTAFIMNSIVAVMAGLIALFQARGWYSKRNAYASFVTALQSKPEQRLAVSNEGATLYIDGGTA